MEWNEMKSTPFAATLISSQIKKKIISSMKKIVKIVFLIFETFSLASKSFVALIEFSNFVMSDALKRLDSLFVNFNKRQILSFFVAFFFLFFHRDKSASLIAFLFFELIRINRKLAQFKKKCFRKFLLSRKR